MLNPEEFVCQDEYLGEYPLFPSSANQSAYYYPHFMSFFHKSIFLPCWMHEALANTCPHDAAKSAETLCPRQCRQGFGFENRRYKTGLIANALIVMAIGIPSSDHTTCHIYPQHHAVDYRRSSL